MKRKILFVVMTAMLLCSVFVGLKLAKSQIANSMAMDPADKVVNPPYGSTSYYWLYPINISTTYAVSMWEAFLYWDPAVIRVSVETPAVWGDFLAGTSPQGYTSITENSIKLGRYSTVKDATDTGDGVLASINFTFVLPAATAVTFLEAVVYDNDMVVYDLLGNSADGAVRSDRPHPVFTWTTIDGLNPLPNHTITDGGDSITHYDVVSFNASESYPSITNYRWEFGDGVVEEGAGKVTTTHIYQDYNKAGWLVNLTVWSGSEYWSTTWCPAGSAPTDTVPMYRDVSVVDIWPSLCPYEYYDEYGLDWWAWWFFDSTDYWIPYNEDPYWDYTLPDSFCTDFGIASGSTVRDFGLYIWILVTATNLGSVPEDVKIDLYAVYSELDLGFKAGPVWIPDIDENVILVDSFTTTIGPDAGTGWGLSTLWTPPKNGFYVFFATVSAADNAIIHDADWSNNYFMMPETLTNTAKWDSTGLSLDKGDVFAGYICDLNGDGIVSAADFTIFSLNFFKKPPSSP